jgi:4-amino-4-deoxy-L-arabinose transferase-like glycosyltransferase
VVPIVLAAALLGVLRIASTWTVFSQTADEPAHVAAGFEWLAQKTYKFDQEHPPLARIAFALPSFADGERGPLAPAKWPGNQLLYRNDRYRTNLAWARAGNLPFFLLALVAVFWWAHRLAGAEIAALAVALLAFLPPILGHAGLATTDMAATATTAAALAAFIAWLDRPGWRRAALLGLAMGAGLLSKFTFLVYFPIGALVAFLASTAMRPRALRHLSLAGQFAGASLLALLLVWGGYRFSIATLDDTRRDTANLTAVALAAEYSQTPGYAWVRPDLVRRYWAYARQPGAAGVDFVDWAKDAGYPSPLAGRAGDPVAGAPPPAPPSLRDRLLEPIRRTWDRLSAFPFPAPEFFVGAEIVADHSTRGHEAFLLGQTSTDGWWYYFPILLLVKTPIPFILLTLAGLWIAAAQGWRERRPELVALAFAPIAMLIPPMVGDINIGVRHILPLYSLFAIAAAIAAAALWRNGAALRIAVVVLLVWYVVAGAMAHPDYMSYFNEVAGGRPERIATDSNLDWGQDLLRLEEEVRRSGIERLYLAYFGTADPLRHSIPAVDLPRGRCVSGWIAVSDMRIRFGGPSNRGDGYEWLARREPTKWVGDSIRLYYVPPGECDGGPS